MKKKGRGTQKDVGGWGDFRAGARVEGAGLKGPRTEQAQPQDVLGKADLQGP